MCISVFLDEEVEVININEFTTIKNVFDNLIQNSEHLKKIKERYFYWIYVDLMTNGDYVSVFAEER